MDVEMDKLVSLCKRRGFIFPSSEIYGGINGFWDYGPLGVELKRNIKEAWWRDNVQIARRHGRAGLLDHHEPEGLGGLGPRRRVQRPDGRLPGHQGALPRRSALRLRLRLPGREPQGRATEAWLSGLGSSPEEAAERPEKKAGQAGQEVRPADGSARRSSPTCSSTRADREKVDRPAPPTTRHADRAPVVQPDVQDVRRAPSRTSRTSPTSGPRPRRGSSPTSRTSSTPAGSSSPSASPRSARASATRSTRATSRSARASSSRWRSSSSAGPTRRQEWYAYWREDAVPVVRRPRPADRTGCGSATTTPEELAFYSTATADIEYAFPFGISELEGIAHRGDYDLSQHMKFSGKDLSYFDEERKERFVAPRRSSPRPGADRAHPGVPLRGVHRGRGRRRGPHRAEVPPQARADQGGRLPAGQARRHAREGRGDLPRAEAAIQRLLRREGGDRPALSPPGRGGHAVLHHRRQPDPGRRHRHVPRPRQLPAVARARPPASPRRSATCSTASRSRGARESRPRTRPET